MKKLLFLFLLLPFFGVAQKWQDPLLEGKRENRMGLDSVLQLPIDTGTVNHGLRTKIGYPYKQNGYDTGQIRYIKGDESVRVWNGYMWKPVGGSGGGTWGSITGTLSAQTDLQAALDDKLNVADSFANGATPLGYLQYTDVGPLARVAVSLTTIGNSGAATYSNVTGIFNVPNYTLAGLGGQAAISYPYTTLKYHTGYGTFGSLPDSVRASLSAGIDILFSGGVISADTTTGDTKIATQGDITRAITASIPTLQQVTTAGGTTNQPITTSSSITAQVGSDYTQMQFYGIFASDGTNTTNIYPADVTLTNGSTAISYRSDQINFAGSGNPSAIKLFPIYHASQTDSVYLPHKGNRKDTVAYLSDVRAGGGGGGGGTGSNLSYDATNHEVDIDGGGTSATIPLALADGATEGLASFTAADFSATAGNISIDKQMSITGDASGLKLVNDQTSPGNSLFYGTNSSGTKGWNSTSTLPWYGLVGGQTQATGTITLGGNQTYLFTGSSPVTWSLPSLSTNGSRFYFIKNAGSAILTIQRDGSDAIYTTSSVTSFTINPGEYTLMWAMQPLGSWYVHQYPAVSGTNTGDVTLTAVGGSPNANGASLSGQALTLQPASISQPGVVTAGTQTFGGAKTFDDVFVILDAMSAYSWTGQEKASDEPTPASGSGIVYWKNDGKLYARNDGGTVYDLTATGGGGLSDSDYGDITVSGSGTVMTFDYKRKMVYTETTATDANITAVAGTAYHLPAATLSTGRTIDVTNLNANGDYVEFYNNEEGFVWSFTGATVYDSDGVTAITELLINANSVIRRINGKLMISKL